METMAVSLLPPPPLLSFSRVSLSWWPVTWFMAGTFPAAGLTISCLSFLALVVRRRRRDGGGGLSCSLQLAGVAQQPAWFRLAFSPWRACGLRLFSLISLLSNLQVVVLSSKQHGVATRHSFCSGDRHMSPILTCAVFVGGGVAVVLFLPKRASSSWPVAGSIAAFYSVAVSCVWHDCLLVKESSPP